MHIDTRRIRAGRRAACLLGIMVVAAGMTACGGGGTGSAAKGQPIKIGLNMNYSGPSGFEGQGVYKGANLAIQELNAKGGVNGHKLQSVLADNQCDPAVGLNAVRNLITKNHVPVIIGSNCSSVTLAQMPIIQQSKVPMLAVEDSNTDITRNAGVGGNPWMFRLNLMDEAMATIFAKNVISKQVQTLAVLAVETDYGQGVVKILQGIPGIKIVSIDKYQLGQSDYRSILAKIKSKHPQGLFFVGDYPEGSQVLNQMHELGIADLKVYTRGDVADPALFKQLNDPASANGLQEANFWGVGLPDSKYVEKAFEAKYHEPLTRPSAMGYFGMKTIANAIGTIKGDVTPTAIRDALQKVDFNLPGLGHVKFDDHHQNWYRLYVNQVQNGKIKLVETVPANPLPGL